MIDQNSIPNNEIAKRPDGLTILCVLSFIGSGMAFISNFMVFFIFPSIPEIMESDEFIQMPNLEPELLLEFLTSAGRSYFLIASLLYLVSIIGVYFMWKLRKTGIHFYAMAQIALLIIPLIFISAELSALPSLLITVLFILLYSRFLKVMY